MRKTFIAHGYQDTAIEHVQEHLKCALFLEMGLGKTVITLTAMKELIDRLEVLKCLIVAPKLVTEQTWLAELNKWEHLEGYTISRIIGSEKQRIKAVHADADFYAVSRDNIKWLVDHLGTKWNFDCIVLDESSSVKNHKSQRFKALKSVRARTKRFLALTGTPIPNGLIDVWSQIYLIDGGVRLERTITKFRDTYFYPEVSDGHMVYKYGLKPGSKELIYEKIGDIALSMKASDWLDLEPRIDIVREFDLDTMAQYKQFKRDRVMELDGEDITGVNAGAMYNKLLQFCNGAVYDADGMYHVVSDQKLDILEEEVEALNGNPVVIFYQFQSDLDRITRRFGKVARIRNENDIDNWNAGVISIAVAHPASLNFGINLQDGGHHVLWFGYPWPWEWYTQAVGRFDRQGQEHRVINKGIIAKGTVEEIVYARLLENGANEKDFINALRRLILD